MPPDAWAGAGVWMVSLNLHLAREMQTVFLVHTAFCLCHGGIDPPRCPLGSQTLQQFVSKRLHCLQLSQSFSQTTLALPWLLSSFFSRCTFWALAQKAPPRLAFPRESLSACTTPQHLQDDKLWQVTRRDGDGEAGNGAGWQERVAHTGSYPSTEEITFIPE